MHLLLIVTGGIAAYKTPDLVRRLREKGVHVTCLLTKAAKNFVTPLALAAVSENPVYEDLWNLKDEREMGHIKLSREADRILVAPASADFLAKIAHGRADDLASSVLLASDKFAIFSPAMNHRMWQNAATQRNIKRLHDDGHTFIEPDHGEMACGEFGPGRMPDISELVQAVLGDLPLRGKSAIVTTGPTIEAIDPVRYLSNHSSGKQGWEIADALSRAGAEVTLISGPTNLMPPRGTYQVDVLSGASMLKAAQSALPADILVCAAAVADYTPTEFATNKIKKLGHDLALTLKPTADILATLCSEVADKTLTIGFAAETENLAENAWKKRVRKGCNWLLANDVGAMPQIFGGGDNQILFLGDEEPEQWPIQSKEEVASKLVEKIIKKLS
ncbi:MAG: bifunctional phosphopantothenoylcysteine decarboxylase/phosphopantothenate--cysteine ligase CoaBC [Alphaproteobacteria bacterium]